MQTMPVNRIFNEWKEWVLVVQPQSCPSLSNDFKDNLNSSYLPKKIWLYQITWIHFILIIDLLYIVQKVEDCFPNCLCQRT